MMTPARIQKGILYLSLLFAFSLPFSRAGINIFGFLLLILWLLEGGFKAKFHTIISHQFTRALVLFLLYLLLVYLWVEPQNFSEANKYNLKYSYFLVIFVLFTSYPKEKAMLLLYAFLLGMCVTLLQSLSIYFHIYDFHEINKDSLSPHMWHTIYSIFLAFTALISLVLFLHKRSLTKKILFLMLFALTTLVLFLGISRTGELIYLLGLAFIMIRLFKLGWKSLALTAIMIALALSTLYTQNALFKSRIDIAKSDITQLYEERDYCTSIGGRLFTWKVAFDVFEKEPLLGLGTIDHTQYLHHAMDADAAFSTCDIKNLIGYYHSQYIELTAQSGLLGLFLLLYIFYTLIMTTIKDPTVSSMKHILVLVFLSAFFLDVPFRKMFTLALFALISSIVLLQERVEHEI